MEHQLEVQKALDIQQQSSGLATERYGIYLESVEAKANKTQTALEGVWQKTINSQTIGQIYDMTTAVLKLIDSVGGFIPIVTALAIVIGGVKLAMMGLNYQLIINNTLMAIQKGWQIIVTLFTALASGVSLAELSLQGFNVALGITQILTGAIVITLAATVLGIGYMSQEAERSTQHLNDLSKAVSDASTELRKIEKDAKTVSELGAAFDELKNKSILTIKEQEKFLEIQNQLKEIMPELSGHYDDQGNFVLSLDTNQKKLNETQQEAIKLQKEKLALAAEESMRSKLEKFIQLDTRLQSAIESDSSERVKKQKIEDPKQYEFESKMLEFDEMSIRKHSFAIKDFINQSKVDFSNLSEEQQKFWADYLRTQGEAGEKLANELMPIQDKWTIIFSKLDKNSSSASDSLKIFTDEIKKSKVEIEKLKETDGGSSNAETIGNTIRDNLKGLAEVQERLAQTASSYDKYKDLATQAFEAVGYSVDENGKVYTELTTTIDGVETVTKQYLDGLEVLDETEQKNIQTVYQSTDAYKAHLQTLKDVAEGEFQINTQLKGLQDTAKLTGSMVARAFGGGTFDFSDVQKLTDANKDYLEFINIVDGQVQINTEGLRQYDIQKAEDAYVTMYQEMAVNGLTEAEQKQLDIMKAYIYSLADGSAYAEELAKEQKRLADEQKKAAEEALRAQRDAIKIQIDILKERKKAADELLKMTIAMIRQEKEAEKDRLEESINNYNKLIDSRIAALDALKAEEDYKKGLEKDKEKIANIKSQIAILALDTSPEAKAKILKLQEELAKLQEDLDDKIADHRLELQKKALEEEKKAFQESMEDKIAVIEDYLKQTGTITQDALDLIKNHGEELYANLIEWNRVYGSGVDQDVVDAWEKGREAVLNYQSIVIEIAGQEELLRNLENVKNNVEQPWDNATAAVKDYSAAVDEALAKSVKGTLTTGAGGSTSSGPGTGSAGGSTTNNEGSGATGSAGGSTSTGNWWEDFLRSIPNLPVMHSGLEAGPAGLKTTTNERLIKVLNDELVINRPQQESLLNRLTPNIPQTTSNISNMMGGNTIKFDNLINIQGNATKEIIPDLEKIANTVLDKINSGNFNRGMKRSSNVTGI